jgi:hypothetical protein
MPSAVVGTVSAGVRVVVRGVVGTVSGAGVVVRAVSGAGVVLGGVIRTAARTRAVTLRTAVGVIRGVAGVVTR